MSARKVIKAIKSYSKFLITSHIDLEGDALGSELALASLLRKMGKTAYIVNDDRTIANYRFLPGVKKVSSSLNRRQFQAAFIVDCPVKRRVGKVTRLVGSDKPIINVDHHIDNENFGRINWVEPRASSTGEMIYRLFELTRTNLDRNDALNIYTAILTDTGSFRYSNTTSRVFYIASQLLKLGIEPDEIYAKIYENNSPQDATVVGEMIARMSFAADNQIAWVIIPQSVFKTMQGGRETIDRILDFAKSISTVKVVIIFRQIEKRLVKLNLRSKRPVNVQKIAKIFGGGGHKLASGCVIKASLKQAEQSVLKQAKRALKGSLRKMPPTKSGG